MHDLELRTTIMGRTQSAEKQIHEFTVRELREEYPYMKTKTLYSIARKCKKVLDKEVEAQ